MDRKTFSTSPFVLWTNGRSEQLSDLATCLEVLLSPHNPAVSFVENYIKLLNDPDTANFQKLPKMKGLKSNEQHSMLEMLRSHIPVGSGSGNTGDSNTGTSEQESSRIKRFEN